MSSFIIFHAAAQAAKRREEQRLAFNEKVKELGFLRQDKFIPGGETKYFIPSKYFVKSYWFNSEEKRLRDAGTSVKTIFIPNHADIWKSDYEKINSERNKALEEIEKITSSPDYLYIKSEFKESFEYEQIIYKKTGEAFWYFDRTVENLIRFKREQDEIFEKYKQ